MYRRFGKRLFDLFFAGILLLCLFPFLILLGILVRLNLGKPVFFCQERPVLGGKIFRIIKFRTMLDRCDADGNPLPDGERLTRFGRFLRASSLDELPELLNVFRGEMSFVGPRPLLVQYLPLYSPEQRRRHDVRPGITGWAQINGRNGISWEEKFQFDLWYADHVSFWIDIKICLLTLKKVLIREGISAEGSATMPEFTGKAKDD